MGDYQDKLAAQLCRYATDNLGQTTPGQFRGRNYGHILRRQDRSLNLVEPFRDSIQKYLDSANPRVKFHEMFHHLNSSQAFAFNLFYPFLSDTVAQPRLLRGLGEEGVKLLDWKFEYVPDRVEATNVDVAWERTQGTWTFCEVKLSENGFGTAKRDVRHMQKLEELYRPRLASVVSAALLQCDQFFANYQILRNISLLHGNNEHRLIFLFPQENEVLMKQLSGVLALVDSDVKNRINVKYVEDVIRGLAQDSMCGDRYQAYACALAEKYLLQG